MTCKRTYGYVKIDANYYSIGADEKNELLNPNMKNSDTTIKIIYYGKFFFFFFFFIFYFLLKKFFLFPYKIKIYIYLFIYLFF